MTQTILVVDDDPGILGVMVSMIKREGYQAIAVQNGREALQQFDRERPDLILLDIAMPGMTGIEVMEEIRRREAGRYHTPIIVLTALAGQYASAEDFKAQIDGFLIKPVTIQKLRQELDRVLGR